jgi:hypothetical protein
MRKKRFNRYTFNTYSYALSFDFCDKQEKMQINAVLRSVWKMYAPSDEKRLDALDVTRKHINGEWKYVKRKS